MAKKTQRPKAYSPRESVHRLARRTLFSFILTFLIARVLVFLIMAGDIPNMYFFLHGTHVHHLNYGIFLLSATAGYSIFWRPVGLKAEATALLYGISLALTFDEFGMWLHLGGSYWQRASVDAVIAVAALIALLSFARSIQRLEASHFRGFVAVLLALALFGFALMRAGNKIGDIAGPRLQQLESDSSH